MAEPMHIAPSNKLVGGGFGTLLGGFIVDELQNRVGILLSSMEITMIGVISGVLVAAFIKDNVREMLEAQVDSLKTRIEYITTSTGEHPPYPPTSPPPPPGSI